MPNPRVTQIIAELPFEKKLVGAGSLLMLVALFFPWYQDLDSFQTGDTFSGLTGPMYFAGFTFLVIASFSILVLVMDYLDKQVPLFKVKTSKLHLWSGIASFYLLLLVGTVYFHPAFGINITVKQSGFGMFMAYSAAALLTIGGYLESRGKAAVKAFEKETREPIVNTVKQQPVVEAKVIHPMIERKPRENLRNMQPRQSGIERQAPMVEQHRQGGIEQPAMDLGVMSSLEDLRPAAPAPAPQTTMSGNGEAQSERKSQPYRMDL